MSDLKRRLANMSPSKRREALLSLPTYLAEASEVERLQSLLTNFDFIDAKVSALATQPLINDYDLALQPEIITSEDGFKGNADNLKLIQGALRLSAHILDEDKTQLAGQLLGRLMSFEAPEIKKFIEQAKQWKAAPWLRPLTPTLRPPTDQLVRTLVGHTGLVSSVVITSDGKRVISGSVDNTLKVWNLETGEELFPLTGHTWPITSVAVTPDGKLAISGSLDKTIKVWDLEARKELFPLIGHTLPVTAIAVTPDGKRVISASLDKTLKVWDLEARQEVDSRPLKVQNRIGLLKLIRAIIDPQVPFLCKFLWLFFAFLRLSWVNSLVVTSDGKQEILASAICFSCLCNSIIKILNLETGEEKLTLKDDNTARITLTLTPDRKRITYSLFDRTIKLWNLDTGDELCALDLQEHSTWLFTLAVTPDGKRMISGSLDKTLKIWNLALEKELFHRDDPAAGVNTVAVIPNSNKVISGSGDNTLKVWDWQTGEKLFNNVLDCLILRKAVAVTADGKQVIAALSDKTIKAWNVQTGEEVFTIKNLASRVNAIAVTPDGKQVIAALSDKTIRAWNWQTGEEIFPLKCPVVSVKALAITPDGKQIIYDSGDNTIKVWNLEKRREICTLTGHTKKIEAVAVTSDGKLIISASRDKTLKVWDLEKRRTIFTLTGHTEKVTSVAVSSDGKWVISSSWDNTVKIWNLSSGGVIASFTGESMLECCTVAPDGVTIIAGEQSGRVHFLRLEGV